VPQRVSARRFDPVWWSSLAMRVATYGVLAAAAIAVVLRQLSSQERYAEQELTRREHQLSDSLTTTQELLAEVVRNTEALQRALLPSEIVAPPGVEVAARQRTSGEDAVWNTWYDTVPLAWGGVALVVGLVDGQDVTAAPVVGLARGALRSYALEGHPPGVVLERANAFLLSAGAARSVTVAYAEIYPDDRLATIAVAGAPSVVVTEPDGRQTPLTARRGPQLGLADAGRWGETTILLPESAALVLSTEAVGAAPDGARQPTDRGPVVVDTAPHVLADEVVALVPAGTPLAVVVARPGAAHHASVHRTLPVHRLSAGVARSWVADLFRVWQESGTLPASAATAEHGDTAALLITELVSNAVRHGDLSVEVRVVLTGQRLRVSVFDSSHRMPVLRRAGAADTAGRGLFLVESMAGAWGVDVRDEGGKDVWFELDLASAPLAEADLNGELDEDALLAAFADDEM
jgi:anti-sigma regulatory factor (Ser/Thr protein kinase)